jgi:hypothetical protein
MFVEEDVTLNQKLQMHRATSFGSTIISSLRLWCSHILGSFESQLMFMHGDFVDFGVSK